MIDLKTMEMFYWTCQLKSFSLAAEKMNTTQSAVSQRISAMEQRLGFRLLERDSRNLNITSEGRAVLGYAEQFIRLKDDMLNQLGFNQKRTINVRLGVSETIVHTWLTVFVESVHECYPKIMLDITVDKSTVMLTQLLNRELDLCFMLGPANEPKLISDPLNSYRLIFCAKPPLLETIRNSPRGTAAVPIVTYPVTAYPFSVLKERFIQSGVKNPRIFTSSSLSTIIKLAQDGMGVALLPEPAARPLLDSNELLEVDLEVRVDPLHFYSIYMGAVDDQVLRELAKLARRISSSY